MLEEKKRKIDVIKGYVENETMNSWEKYGPKDKGMKGIV